MDQPCYICTHRHCVHCCFQCNKPICLLCKVLREDKETICRPCHASNTPRKPAMARFRQRLRLVFH